MTRTPALRPRRCAAASGPCRLLSGVLVALVGILPSGPAAADDLFWIAPVPNIFLDVEAWFPVGDGPPTIDDTAIFDQGTGSVVQLIDNRATANLVVRDDDVTVLADTFTWTVTDLLTIGEGAGDVGILRLPEGSLRTTATFIAPVAGSTGTFTFDPLNGSVPASPPFWGNSGSVFVGGDDQTDGGNGTLAVSNGGTVDVGDLLRIRNPGSLDLAGGRLTTHDFLRDPAGGLSFSSGRLVILGGVMELNANGIGYGSANGVNQPTFDFADGGRTEIPLSWTIGQNAGTFGATVVRGVGAEGRSMLRSTQADADADLVVGSNGTGQLTVADGGLVEFGDDVRFGNNTTGDGTGRVTGVQDGVRATLRTTGASGGSSSIEIGNAGVGDLGVDQGGLVESQDDLRIGGNGGQGFLTVEGASEGFEATVLVGDDLWIGTLNGTTDAGRGRVTVRDGGRIEVADETGLSFEDFLTIEGGVFRTHSLLRVEDPSLGFTFADVNLNDGRLEIDGGTLQLGEDFQFGEETGTSPVLQLSNGATWFVGDDLVVGDTASGLLVLESGSTADVEDELLLGDQPDGFGHVTLLGVGTSLSTERLTGGEEGEGLVEVFDGAALETRGLAILGAEEIIGGVSGGTGSARLVVDGGAGNPTRSSWTVAQLAVGMGGEGELDVRNGGLVGSVAAVIGSTSFVDEQSDTPGSGVVSVSGVGTEGDPSEWQVGSLQVGLDSDGMLGVLEGGLVESTNAILGVLEDGEGEVVVAGDEQGIASTWRNSGGLALGGEGDAFLQVLDGGRVETTGSVDVGRFSSSLASVVVARDGSAGDALLQIGGDLTIGAQFEGEGAPESVSVHIEGGGRVEVPAGTTTVLPNASLVIDGGTLRTGDLVVFQLLPMVGEVAPAGDPSFGDFQFLSGTLALTNSDFLVGEEGLFGSDVSLLSRALEIGLTTRIDPGARLALDGGSLETGLLELPSGSTLELNGGRLFLTGQSLTIGRDGLFGLSLELEGTTIGSAETVTIERGAALDLGTGAGLEAGFEFVNEGLLRARGAIVSVSGVSRNGGVIELENAILEGVSDAAAAGSGVSPSGTGGGGGSLENEADGVLRGTGLVDTRVFNDGLIHATAGAPLVVTVGVENEAGGEVLVDDRGRFEVDGGWQSLGTVTLGGSSATIGGASFTNDGLLRGVGRVTAPVNNLGTIRPDGGRLTFTGEGNQNGGGRIEVGAGEEVLFSAGLGVNGGEILLTGGEFDNGGEQLHNDGAGRIAGRGVLRTGLLVNDGEILFADGETDVFGAVENRAELEIVENVTTFFDSVMNGTTGTIKNTGGVLRFLGGLVNDGAFVSDPAENLFADIELGESGYLVGGAGDRFVVMGDVLSTSYADRRWDTREAALAFAGAGEHRLSVGGEDRGEGYRGYWRNFGWGALELGAGGTLVLEDGNGEDGGALYVGALRLGGGLDQLGRIVSNGMNVYYDPRLEENAYLGGGRYSLPGGGLLAAVPEPGTGMLLACGLVGIAARRQVAHPVV